MASPFEGGGAVFAHRERERTGLINLNKTMTLGRPHEAGETLCASLSLYPAPGL
jgi:hypothetical protein